MNSVEPKIYFATQGSVENLGFQRQWYHQYPDIFLSILLITAGVSHFVFKRFVLPSPRFVKDELDHQRALEAFYTSPYFGIILMGLGFVLLICSLLFYFFKS